MITKFYIKYIEGKRSGAASCIKAYEIIVIARNFARIFLQNSINVGLQMIICPDIDAREGDELEVRGNEVFNLTTGKSFVIESLPQARQEIIDAGGLIPYVRSLLLADAIKE